ncbi:MAG: 50S ribosomal protein L17 [Spirochaetes bacterium]|nr:MAG: 50S ribosomal protein L17 [Spirochaetota bacterium]
MHNRKGFNRLGRKASHRKALHRNMVTSLIKYERIETTQAKAKEIRRTAEKLVTRAKVDSVHNRRIVAKTVYEKDMVNKLFTEVGPRFTERPGGYTRILKLGKRSGDAADMVILEFLSDENKNIEKKKPAAKKKTAKKPAVKKPAAEKKIEIEAPASEDSVVESDEKAEEVKAEEVKAENPAVDKPEAEKASE